MRQITQMHSRCESADSASDGSRALKNSRHERLALEYVGGASKAEAWRTVFGREPANAARTFRRPNIQARVEYLRGELNRLAGISLAALQTRLLRIADANVPQDFFESGENGRLKLRDLPSLPRAVTAPITELQVDKDGAIKLKVADKLHALDTLVKTIGGFAPGPAGNDKLSLEDLVMASMQGGGRTRVSMQVVTSPSTPSGSTAPNQSAATATVRRVKL